MSIGDQRTKLWEISSDLFDLVSLRLSGGSILDLWCTGDRNLRRLMENGGVRTLIFEDDGRGTTSRFPHCLRFFRGLKELSFDRPRDMLDHVDVVRRGLQSVSSTLEKLRLSFHDAELVLLDVDWGVEGPSGDIKMGDSDENVKRCGRLWNMSEYWPNLKFFEINSMDGPGDLVDEDVGDLPLSLVELRLKTTQSQLTKGVWRYLSPQLRILEIRLENSTNLTPEDLSSLPPLLESFYWNESIPCHIFPDLPPSITFLEAHKTAFSYSNLHFAPLALKRLVLQSHATNISSISIPTHISDLILIGPRHGAIEASIDATSFLPPHLISLRSYFDLHISSHTKWPSSLRQLLIHGHTSWSFQKHTDSPSNPHSSLPPDAQSFASMLGVLPNELRELSLRLHQGNKIREFPPFNLPFLSKLSLSMNFQLSQSLFQNVSRTLRCLTLRPAAPEAQTVGEAENLWFSFLPSTLQDLVIYDMIGYGFTAACLEHLPRQLKALQLDFEGQATKENFFALPRSLKRLSLPFFRSADYEATHTLPQGLTELELSRLETPIDLSNLPIHLECLIAHSLPITLSPQVSADLPRSLHTIMLGHAQIIPAQIHEYNWPPILSHLHISNTTLSDDHTAKRTSYINGNFLTPDPRVIARFSNDTA